MPSDLRPRSKRPPSSSANLPIRLLLRLHLSRRAQPLQLMLLHLRVRRRHGFAVASVTGKVIRLPNVDAATNKSQVNRLRPTTTTILSLALLRLLLRQQRLRRRLVHL